ncbi:hypothetical protein AGMMS49975_01560 [Clostridia bacterium]|nr:hypothetical protein AGMMS49975_01560 [Clostridia bacterium]
MELSISPDFTIDDIHKIREYNYEMTKGMTLAERNAYIWKGAERALKQMEELKRVNKKEV